MRDLPSSMASKGRKQALPARLLDAARAFRGVASKYKTPIMLAAAALFLGGVVWSSRSIGFALGQMQWAPVAGILLVLVPASLIVAAWNLMITGRLMGKDIGFGEALSASAYGRVAELLPVPGSIMARAAVLLQKGAGMGETALVLAWSSFLTLALAALLLAAAFVANGLVWGWAVGGSALLFVIVSAVWLTRRIGAGHFVQQLAVRLAALGLGAVRIYLCFLALSMPIDLLDGAAFVIASSLTSMIGIVPAGLGDAEGIGAGLALLVDIAPAAAFLALALNRLLGLVVNACAALVLFNFSFHRKPQLP